MDTSHINAPIPRLQKKKKDDREAQLIDRSFEAFAAVVLSRTSLKVIHGF